MFKKRGQLLINKMYVILEKSIDILKTDFETKLNTDLNLFYANRKSDRAFE